MFISPSPWLRSCRDFPETRALFSQESHGWLPPCRLIGNYTWFLCILMELTHCAWILPTLLRDLGEQLFSFGGPQVAPGEFLFPITHQGQPNSRPQAHHDCLSGPQTPGRPRVLNSFIGSHGVRRTSSGSKGGLGSFLSSHQPCELPYIVSGPRRIAGRDEELVSSGIGVIRRMGGRGCGRALPKSLGQPFSSLRHNPSGRRDD